jgi:hypothetical protein
VLAKEGGDLRHAVATIIGVAKSDDAKKPFDAVKRLAGFPAPASNSSDASAAH